MIGVDPQKIIDFLREELQITEEELLRRYRQEDTIPATIFQEELTALESISTYLHNKGLTTTEIAQKTKRPYNSIRAAINNTKNKNVTLREETTTPYTIPLQELREELSPAEAVTHYLHKNYQLTPTQISELLQKDPRNITATLTKAKKKLRGETQ
ncbi:MAG: hypothetical protein ACMXYD_04000 [Candidatus Woesearchaeota archaeon]